MSDEVKKTDNPEKQYIVSHSTLRPILDYLISRPYTEVFSLVQGIQMVREYQEPVQTIPQQEGNTNESGN